MYRGVCRVGVYMYRGVCRVGVYMYRGGVGRGVCIGGCVGRGVYV